MWIALALGSCVFAGITTVLAKMGLARVNSTLATALRTVVVLAFAWLIVFITGAQRQIGQLTPVNYLFLALSGLATGGSWLCYFKALQTGPVAGVAAVDKSSTVLTMLLAFLLLGETIGPVGIVGLLLLAGGTLLMLPHIPTKADFRPGGWLAYALASAVYAALTSILGKVGVQNIDSNLATALRTVVVLVAAFAMAGVSGQLGGIAGIDKRSWVFLVLSGVATGASWLCFYRALQSGPASVVVPLDKLSIVVSVIGARLLLHEKISRKTAGGLLVLVAGTLLLLV